jgi:hypothetical protein
MDRGLGAAGQQGREDTARRPEFLHYIGDSLAASSEGEKAREMPQARVGASAPGPEMLPCQHLFSKLDAGQLSEIFNDCLYGDDENTTGYVRGDGIMHNFGFHPDRLNSHRQEISAMLDELPPEFHEDSGGGMSFLNACVDKNNRQWGEHQNMEQLFALGQAIGRVKSCFPRGMWNMLPGAMPYYVIRKETEDA